MKLLSIGIFCIHVCEVVVGSTYLGKTFILKDPGTCCSTNPLNPASNCAQTTLIATAKFQYAPSPGFPNRFPVDRQCTWTLQSRPQARIRLEFRDFYLIGPNSKGECSDQYVSIQSPTTGYEMGPYCGNTGIQVIVSAGNLLVVQLHSGIPISSENFRGFTMAFKETYETPSSQLRPQNWVPNSAAALDAEGLQQVINGFLPQTQTPNVITTPKTKKRKQPNRRPTTIRPRLRPTPVPPLNKQRPYFAAPVPGGSRHYGPYDNRPVQTIDKTKSSKSSKKLLSTEVICGIAVGGLVGLALIILISCKISQVRKDKEHNKGKNGKETNGKEDNDVQMNEMHSQPQHGSINKVSAIPDPNIKHGYAQESQPQKGQKHCRNTLQYPPSNEQPPSYNTLPPSALPNRAPGGNVEPVTSNYNYYNDKNHVASFPMTIPSAPAPSGPVVLYDPQTGALFNSNQLQVVQPAYNPYYFQPRAATMPIPSHYPSHGTRKTSTSKSQKKQNGKKKHRK